MTKRKTLAVVAFGVAILIAGCSGGSGLPSGGSADFEPADYEGNWTGQWQNQTFGSQGAAAMDATVDTAGKTLELVIDLDGNVLGGANPPAMTFNSTYTEVGTTINQAIPGLGAVSATINGSGRINGSITNLANPAISSVDFTGTATKTRISLSYTVRFSSAGGGGVARGTLVLDKT